MKKACLIFGISVFTALLLWTREAETKAHFSPDYERIDLSLYLDREELSEDEYDVLFRQTGLAPAGIRQLYEDNCQYKLLFLQERFYEKTEIECGSSVFAVRSERLVPDVSAPVSDVFPVLQDGDILVTFSSHILGWRSGHAGIVVDSDGGLTLEAICLGQDTAICSLEKWKTYPCTAVLRLKDASVQDRAAIADYAEENLTDIAYRLDAFAVRDNGFSAETDPRDSDSLSGTQCAHLIWWLYYQFGYDLNGGRGGIVTPADLFRSEELDLVQIYGIDPGDVKNF